MGDPAAQSPATAGHPSGRASLRLRAQDRRPGDVPHLRERRLHSRRDPGRWGDWRGGHPKPQDDQGDPAADRRGPRTGRGARGGLPAAGRVRRAQRGALGGRRARVRKSSKRGGGLDPPARSQGRRRATAVDLVLRDRRAARARPGYPHRRARLAARARLQGEPRDPGARDGRRGGRALPVVGGSAGGARLRDRRRGDQGGPAHAMARAGRRRPRAALGGRVEVRADYGDDEAQAHLLERGANRRPLPVRRARAGAGRGRHRFDGHPPQRGGPGPQGRARGRRGRGHPRRRRDPAGGLAADSAAQGQAAAPAQATCQVPRLRNADGEARRQRVHAVSEPARLSRPDVPAREALRSGDGHRGVRREAL